jgi:hypothetical protein
MEEMSRDLAELRQCAVQAEVLGAQVWSPLWRRRLSVRVEAVSYVSVADLWCSCFVGAVSVFLNISCSPPWQVAERDVELASGKARLRKVLQVRALHRFYFSLYHHAVAAHVDVNLLLNPV